MVPWIVVSRSHVKKNWKLNRTRFQFISSNIVWPKNKKTHFKLKIILRCWYHGVLLPVSKFTWKRWFWFCVGASHWQLLVYRSEIKDKILLVPVCRIRFWLWSCPFFQKIAIGCQLMNMGFNLKLTSIRTNYTVLCSTI